jgi:hypothetical protein
MKLINFLVTLVISMMLATPLTAHITGCTVLEHPATGKRFVLIYRTPKVSAERFTCNTPIETVDSKAISDWLITKLAYASEETAILRPSSDIAQKMFEESQTPEAICSVDSQLLFIALKNIRLGNVSFPESDGSMLSQFFDLRDRLTHLYGLAKAAEENIKARCAQLAHRTPTNHSQSLHVLAIKWGTCTAEEFFKSVMQRPEDKVLEIFVSGKKIIEKFNTLHTFVSERQKEDSPFKEAYTQCLKSLNEIRIINNIDAENRDKPFSFLMMQHLSKHHPTGSNQFIFNKDFVLNMGRNIYLAFAHFYIPYAFWKHPDKHLVAITTLSANHTPDSINEPQIMINHLKMLGYQIVADGDRKLKTPGLLSEKVFKSTADERRAKVYAILADTIPLKHLDCLTCNHRGIEPVDYAKHIASGFEVPEHEKTLTKTLLYYLHEAYQNTSCDVTNQAWNNASLIVEVLQALSKPAKKIINPELKNLGLSIDDIRILFSKIVMLKNQMLAPRSIDSTHTRGGAASTTVKDFVPSAAASISPVAIFSSASELASDVAHAQLVQAAYEELLQTTITGDLKKIIQSCLHLEDDKQPTITQTHYTLGMIFAALETKVTPAQAHSQILYYKTQNENRIAPSLAPEATLSSYPQVATHETQQAQDEHIDLALPEAPLSSVSAPHGSSDETARADDDDDEWEAVTAAKQRPSTSKVFISHFAGIPYTVTLHCAKRLRLLDAAAQEDQRNLIRSYNPQAVGASSIQQRFLVLNNLPTGSKVALRHSSGHDYSVMLPPGNQFASYDENVTNKIDLYHLMAPELDQYLLSQGIFERTSFDDGSPRLTCNLIVDLTVNQDSATPQTVRGCMQYGFLPGASSYHHRCFIPLKRCSEKLNALITEAVTAGKVPVVIADVDKFTTAMPHGTKLSGKKQ